VLVRRSYDSTNSTKVAWAVIAAVVVLVAIGAIVASGSGSASSQSSASQLNVCGVFTLTDAQAILGAATTSPGPLGGEGSCVYLSDAPTSTPPPTLISINVYDGQPLSVAESYDGGPPKRDSAVNGLGSSARWYFYGRSAAGVLDVHDHQHVVRVMVGGSQDDRATAVATARVILEHLP
jgi:hypothetical protein